MAGVAVRVPVQTYCQAASRASELDQTSGGASTSCHCPAFRRQQARWTLDELRGPVSRPGPSRKSRRLVAQAAGRPSGTAWREAPQSLAGAATLFGQDSQRQGGWRLDSWLAKAVEEIVHHLPEAPFLHYVFDGPEKKRREREVMRVPDKLFQNADHWQDIKGEVVEAAPDGIILVQKLAHEDAARGYGAEHRGATTASSAHWVAHKEIQSVGTDVWGLVVQGRRGAHSCYILKTTRLISCNQICTRYSLTKAVCFGPELHKQLENTWLA